MKINKKKNVIIIDVRTHEEFLDGHLPNAINIPHTYINDYINLYSKKKDDYIILYCKSGIRSGFSEKLLKNLGYENAVNAGGYKDLKENLHTVINKLKQ